MARACLACALLACIAAIDVEKPYWCPLYTWKAVCKYAATCESLAMAGLTCEGVALIDGCDNACAAPCCVTTSTTTLTSTLTKTFTTVTATETHTSTITATATETSTVTKTSSTSETSVTTTATITTRTMPTTTGEPTLGPAAVMRVAMRVKVIKPEDDMREYLSDPRVKGAYMAVMTNLTGVPEDQVEIEMAETPRGNLTVICTLTIPYVDNGTALVPSVPLAPMQAKLVAMDMASFNTMIKDAVDAATGEGTYSQQVLSVTDATGAADVSAGRIARPVSIWVTMIVALAVTGLLRR